MSNFDFKNIYSTGYWTFIFYPLTKPKEKMSLSTLEKLIIDNGIHLRNWTFPYYDSRILNQEEDGIITNNCITNIPEFYSDFNFHFTEESPCINAGINLPNIWDETDLNGNSRVQGGTVDMGCYEGPIPEPGLFILSFFSLFLISKGKSC